MKKNNKIFFKISDYKRELKKGEIKEILISEISNTLSEFNFENYQSNSYYFQRVRNYKHFPIYEILAIAFSLKNKIFSCSISSCFDKEKRFSNEYNTGKLNRHTALIVLKKNSTITPMDEKFYYFNGRVEAAKKLSLK